MNIMYARKTLPYTTSTGVKIGLFYIPPPEYKQDWDAYAMQLALLKLVPKQSFWRKFFL
jgi:hypothetical protein